MRKVLKVIGIILLIIVLLIAAGLGFLYYVIYHAPMVPKEYWNEIKTGGTIEANYLARGEYEVAYIEEKADEPVNKYVIYYPEELEQDKYPVVVVVNGTGVFANKEKPLFEHLASWGFIVIGNHDGSTWSGKSADLTLEYLLRLNEDESSIFYQKIDTENIGITGHSQGGVGVFNAITEQRHGDLYKAAVSLSPTNKKLAHDLEWDYDAAQIDTPVLLLSGAGGGDDWVVTGEQLEEIYNDVSGSKVMLRRKDTPHGEMLYAANGYVTAWFMYWLQADREAGKAFWGDAPEIAANPLYQDPKIRLAE